MTNEPQSWPPEALTESPEFPFELDRHVYESPKMAEWREQHSPLGSWRDRD